MNLPILLKATRWVALSMIPYAVLRSLPLIALLAAPTAAQEAAAPQSPFPTFTSDQLETYFFTPEHVNAREIDNIAAELYGRKILVQDHGAASQPIYNIQRLGDSLIIYDSKDYVQKFVVALQHLDEQAGAAASAPRIEVMTTEWSPRYMSLESAVQAIEPFQRMVRSFDENGIASDTPNFSVLRERSVIVLRDTPQRVTQIVETLSRIDEPEPQLMLDCMIIQGTHQPLREGASAPPEELVKNLSALVPFPHFRLQTMGLVRTSVAAHEIELAMDNDFRLALRPDAFDAKRGTLTAVCEFIGEVEHVSHRFETRTTIQAGEYTVLGATGSEPLFVVLRMRMLEM